MRCRYCGKKYSDKLWICPKCGKVRRAGSRDKWKAFRLCLFFGWCGAHCFYEGAHLRGITMIITIGGFFGFYWIKELIRILKEPDPYYPHWRGRSYKRHIEKEKELIRNAVAERNNNQLNSTIVGLKNGPK